MALGIRIRPASPSRGSGWGDLRTGGRAGWVLSTPRAGRFGGPHQLHHPWAVGQDAATEAMG